MALLNLIKRRIAVAISQTDILELTEKIEVLYASGSFGTPDYTELIELLTAKMTALGLT